VQQPVDFLNLMQPVPIAELLVVPQELTRCDTGLTEEMHFDSSGIAWPILSECFVGAPVRFQLASGLPSNDEDSS
jgi:hypothetical protein